MAASIKVAVITGGHTFDVIPFHQLFRRLEGIDAYLQPLGDFATSPQEVRRGYDAVAFYNMHEGIPQDEGQPWYEGKPRTALEALGETPQGIVILHHALLAYEQWPAWDAMIGIRQRRSGFSYAPRETVHSLLHKPDHPILVGLASWDMIDETYVIPDAGTDSDILITYDHPKSMHTIAWTRKYRNSRVFCYQAGHDGETFDDPNFREVLRRGLLWSAGQLG